MSQIKVVTHSGSVYFLDLLAKTWERVLHSQASGRLRTERGLYLGTLSVTVGRRMNIHCPSMFTNGPERMISTSAVIEIGAA